MIALFKSYKAMLRNIKLIQKEERIDAIKKMIKLSRKLNASNDFILKQLTEDYGSYFSQKELKQFIKNN